MREIHLDMDRSVRCSLGPKGQRLVVFLLLLSITTREAWARARHAKQNLGQNDNSIHSQSKKLNLLNRFRRNSDESLDVKSFFEEVNRYGALDVVFILERSYVLGKDYFYNDQVKFVKNLIRNYMYVAPGHQYTHVSLLTFGQDVSVIFNGVEENKAVENVTKCDLVESNHLWNKVQYLEGAPSHGINLMSAIQQAKEILRSGRQLRNHARSHIVLLTSASYGDHDLNYLRSDYNAWFNAYLVGSAHITDLDRLRTLAIAFGTNVVYNSLDEWKRTMTDPSVQNHHTQVDFPSQWIEYRGTACSCSSICYCDIITGYTRCSCPGGYLDKYGTCKRPCDSAPCPYDLFECRLDAYAIHYTCVCRSNIGSVPCDPRLINECSVNPCQNGGQCVDGINQYSCMCSFGWTGRNCEVRESGQPRQPGQPGQPGQCSYNSCPSGQQCIQEQNGFQRCVQPAPQTAAPTPQPFPPRTSTYSTFSVLDPHGAWLTSGILNHITNRPTVYKKTTTGVSVQASVDKTSGENGFLSSLSNGERLMLIILPSAGVAFLVLITGIGGLIYVLAKKERKNGDKSNLSGLTETTSIASHNPSLMTFDSKCYKDEGTPGAPKAHILKAEEANKITYGNFDDVMYDNEAIQRGMEDWYAHVLELYHNQGLNRILIVRLDGEKWVMSPGTKLYMEEIEKTYNLLSKTIEKGTIKIQGREFGIVSNDDFVIIGHTFRNTKLAQEIACATKTRQFVIIATADFSVDNGRCKEKVLHLRDHIKNQGL